MRRVYSVIGPHARPGDTAEETFKRICAKAIQNRIVKPFEKAWEFKATPTWWPFERFKPMMVRDDLGPPHEFGTPVVVLRLGGVDILVDGSRRLNQAFKQGEAGHEVLLVEIKGG